MTAPKADRFPVIIDEWPLGRNGELVRVVIGRFNDSFTVDIRCWWQNDNGVFKPGRTGLNSAYDTFQNSPR